MIGDRALIDGPIVVVMLRGGGQAPRGRAASDRPRSITSGTLLSLSQGENRKLAEYLDEKLAVLDVPVFYDANFEANYLGKTWSAQFKDIFGEKSRYVVCILDKHHSDKIWPTFEREIFMPRVVSGTVIPIFLDDTKFVGIPHDVIGIKFKFDLADPDWQKKANDEIITKLIDKLSE